MNGSLGVVQNINLRVPPSVAEDDVDIVRKYKMATELNHYVLNERRGEDFRGIVSRIIVGLGFSIPVWVVIGCFLFWK